ncbi:MAG TPA: hypothetical protein VFD43_10830 [Planctomycetota bacterium]|nr:hypothetical protein [Planctomycetota bacterium]
MKKLLAATLLAIALPSCAHNAASDYALNRINDLGDAARFSVKAGAGIGIEYEWTRMAGIGLLYEYKCWSAGWSNRELGYWNESIFFWGFIVMHRQEDIHSGSPNPYSGSYGWVFGKEGGNIIELNQPNNPLDMINARLTVMLGLGADLDLRVGEWIDFAVGLFQFDPAGDDHHYSEMRRIEGEEAEETSEEPPAR